MRHQEADDWSLAKHKPLAIVSLMLGIREDVVAAMAIAGCDVMHINTPFPGMGQQKKFRDQMRAALGYAAEKWRSRLRACRCLKDDPRAFTRIAGKGRKQPRLGRARIGPLAGVSVHGGMGWHRRKISLNSAVPDKRA